MNKFLAAVLAAALSCGAAWAQTPPAAIPLQPYLGTKAVRASVNGHEGMFLFDSGGGVSLLTPQFAAAVGCKPWGRISGFRMTGERIDMTRCDGVDFQVGGQTLHAPTAGVFDLAPLLPPDAPPLAGILALDAFAGRAVTIDLSGGTLAVETPASLATRVRQAREVPLHLVRDAGGVALSTQVGVATSQGTAWMELDTGANGALVLARHVAALFGVDPAGTRPQAATLQLGGGGVQLRGQAVVMDLIMDGNVGSKVLKDWVVTLDLGAGRAWLAPAGR